jgi:hypothetical protein
MLYVEAEDTGGADGSTVTIAPDLSSYGRDLIAASGGPVVDVAAVNGKRSWVFDGTKTPLKFDGTFKIRCGWMVARINGDFETPYEGLLSTPSIYGILAGIGATSQFFDFEYDYFEYRLNDRIYFPQDAPAPRDEWGVIFFKFWTNLVVDGIQIGQDREFTDRKLNGEVALLALYDRDFCEDEIRRQTRAIAYEYQIALADSFPYQGMKSDTGEVSPVVLSDGQIEPITRTKSRALETFDASFAQRTQEEFREAKAFHSSHYPGERFLYRDYQQIPPVDYNVRITSAFEKRGLQTVNNFGYAFSMIESDVPAAAAIPATAPEIPVETPEPTVPEGALTFGGEVLTFGGEPVIFG